MALSSGVYSLIGVAVGSGVTWVAQWSLAARSDRLDTQAAKRQVLAELLSLRGGPVNGLAMLPVEALGRYELGLGRGFAATEKWAAHSDQLARQLSTEDWNVVASAYRGVEKLRFEAERDLISSEEVRRANQDDLRQSAERTIRLIAEAVERLR